MPDQHSEALSDLGKYIRAQREVARLSLRHLARVTNVSDSYLSQVERGLYRPSAEVLKSIAEGLGISADDLFRRLGWLDQNGDETSETSVLAAIAADERLSPAQRSALAQTYKAMVGDS